MTVPDPFVHLPSLRHKIVDPGASRFRLAGDGVEFWDEMAAKAGYPADWRHPDDVRDGIRRRFLSRHQGGDLWVFAYGSLMWDPAIYFEEIRCATLTGWRRSFCLRIELGRGAPGSPALMAALDGGGDCHGLALRIAADRVETETEMLWRREMITDGYVAERVPVMTPQGEVEALAFVADHNSPKYVGELEVENAAAIIAGGTGVLGSNIEYLDELAGNLQSLAVPDDRFFELYRRAQAITAG